MVKTKQNPIQKKQITQIQCAFAVQKVDRDERLFRMSEFFKKEITSTKELSSIEADELIYFLNTGNKTAGNWAFFDDKQGFASQRKYLWSLCHQANWETYINNAVQVDTVRLSNFIKSAKSPVKKPLKEWKREDWKKMIFVFEKIVKGTFKV